MLALASVAHMKVEGSIPGQGTCLGCRCGPWLGGMGEAANQCFSLTSTFLSLSFSSFIPLSLRSISMTSGAEKIDKHIKVKGIIVWGESWIEKVET